MQISYYANKKSSQRLPSWQPSIISFNTPIDSGSIIKPCTLKHFQVPILAPGLPQHWNMSVAACAWLAFRGIIITDKINLSPEPVSQIIKRRMSHSHSSTVRAIGNSSRSCGASSSFRRIISQEIWIVSRTSFSSQNRCCCPCMVGM